MSSSKTVGFFLGSDMQSSLINFFFVHYTYPNKRNFVSSILSSQPLLICFLARSASFFCD